MLILIFLNFAHSQTLKCANDNLSEYFSIGGNIIICMHFVDQITLKSQRLAFQVSVDTYSAINAQSAYQTFKSSQNISLQIQANKATFTSSAVVFKLFLKEQLKPYILNNTNIFSLFSIVVTMDNGNVTDLVWDNGCWEGAENCYKYVTGVYEDQNNYMNSTNCGLQNSTSCDPKIYISFIGTDSSGNYLESAGMRISRFQQYSIGQMYSSAKGVFNSYT